MSMDRFSLNRRFLHLGDVPPMAQFREISKCIVRKDHSCGKFLGASKSCFIACPSTDEVETMLALITEKLTKIGIEPVIAIKERAYGEDIFCTKICGKIIESQFCLVILDDSIEPIDGKSVNIPNPNVYYEYGLMTALNKHVIPLQKDGQKLAFNIQTHDTIKYTPRNLSIELDKAFKDTIKITQENRSGYEQVGPSSQRLFSRCLEINGYQRKDYKWFLSDDFEDTVFSCFGHPNRQEYLFFAVASDRELLRSALTDAQVIIKRLEVRYDDMTAKIKDLSSEAEKLSKEIEEAEEMTKTGKGISRPLTLRSSIASDRRSLDKTIEERDDLSSKLELMQNSKFGIVLIPEIIELKSKVIDEYNNMDRQKLSLPLYIGDITGIQIANINIVFKHPNL